MELITPKVFPTHYPSDAVQLLDALSMTNGKGLLIVGSSSLRSQLYAGDIDAMERVKVKSSKEFATKLQDVVKRVRDVPSTYIVEVKCGEIPEWNVFRPTARVEDCKIHDFNPLESQTIVDSLLAERRISKQEATEAIELLKKATTIHGFLEARKSIRFHILRWSVPEILEGAMEYRGAVVRLEDAIESGGLTKIDTISAVRGVYTEISMLYELFIGRKKVSGPPDNVIGSLQEDILFYNKTNAFKALKRLFAIARFNKESKLLSQLVPILNSDLGRLNQIVGDVGTLLSLMERPSPPLARIRLHIRDLQARLGSLYQFKDLLQSESQLTGHLEAILKTSSQAQFVSRLELFEEQAKKLLHRLTIKLIEGK